MPKRAREHPSPAYDCRALVSIGAAQCKPVCPPGRRRARVLDRLRPPEPGSPLLNKPHLFWPSVKRSYYSHAEFLACCKRAAPSSVHPPVGRSRGYWCKRLVAIFMNRSRRHLLRKIQSCRPERGELRSPRARVAYEPTQSSLLILQPQPNRKRRNKPGGEERMERISMTNLNQPCAGGINSTDWPRRS